MDDITPYSVVAPASSANLGPLFDVAGLALGSLTNRVTVTAGTGRVTVIGEGADTLPTDHTNLVAACFAEVAGDLIDEVDLTCDNAIPLARGLGSSTAAAACGLLAACHAIGEPRGQQWLLEQLTRIDGHPDNAAACTYGGLVLARATVDGVLTIRRLPLSPDIEFVAVVPHRELQTSESRAVLPDVLPREDIAAQIAASAHLISLACSSDPDTDALRDALHGDRLHEPARAGLVPELSTSRKALADLEQGIAFGATLSGAGPTVLVWHRTGQHATVVDALESALPDCSVIRMLPSKLGAFISPS